MTSFIEIDGTRHPITSATLDLYHCDSPEADWNLELETASGTRFLSGTVEPSPKKREDLAGAKLRIEVATFDEVLDTLLGFPITSYPNGQDVSEAFLDATLEGDAVHLYATFELDWDKAIDPPGKTFATPRRATIDLRATLRDIA